LQESTNFDTLNLVDTTLEEVMLRSRRDRDLVVEFCDGCGSVCDAACRRELVLADARDKAIHWGRL
jgi:hypothetical protein